MSNKGKVPNLPVVSAPKAPPRMIEVAPPERQPEVVYAKPLPEKVAEPDSVDVRFKGQTLRYFKPTYYVKNRPCDACGTGLGGRMKVTSRQGRVQYLKCDTCGFCGKDSVPSFVAIEEIATIEKVEFLAVITLSEEQAEKIKSGELKSTMTEVVFKPSKEGQLP